MLPPGRRPRCARIPRVRTCSRLPAHHIRIPKDAHAGSEFGGLSPKQDCDLDLEHKLSKKSSNLLPVFKYQVGDATGTEETHSQNPTTMRSSMLEHSSTVAKQNGLPPSPQESPIHRQESPSHRQDFPNGPSFPEPTPNYPGQRGRG